MRSKPPRGWWSHTTESDYEMFRHYGLPYLPGAWRATYHRDEHCAALLDAPFTQPTTFPGTAKTCESCGHPPVPGDLGTRRVQSLQQVMSR